MELRPQGVSVVVANVGQKVDRLPRASLANKRQTRPITAAAAFLYMHG